MLNPWQLLASQLQELNLQGTELSHRVKVAAIGREKSLRIWRRSPPEKEDDHVRPAGSRLASASRHYRAGERGCVSSIHELFQAQFCTSSLRQSVQQSLTNESMAKTHYTH